VIVGENYLFLNENSEGAQPGAGQEWPRSRGIRTDKVIIGNDKGSKANSENEAINHDISVIGAVKALSGFQQDC
jgi:hypothetical protein